MAYLRILLGLVVSAICIVALLTQVDLERTWTTLTQAQPLWLLLTVGVLVLNMVSKAIVWRLLYYPVTGLHLRNLFSTLYIGYLVSTVTPMRLGEVARAYLVTKTEPVTFSQSVGTVLVEKVLDLLTVLAFLAALSLLVPLPELAVPGWVLAAFGLVGLVGLLGLAYLPRGPLLRALTAMQRRLPLVRRLDLAALVGPFLDALAVLRYREVVAALTFWQVVVWLESALGNYLVMVALGLPAPFAAAVFVTIVTSLGMIVPSAPGYVGVFHYLSVVAVTAFGVDASQAMSYALVSHAVTYGSFVVGGLYYVWRGGYHFGDLLARRHAAPTAL
jgi:uncharacterized protein (TIRG00374 family)